jgi:DNA-binding NtrC family response regulator
MATKKTILVVEDELSQRRALEAVVQRAGYGVLGVGDGKAAIDLLTSNHGNQIHAVLLDLQLPKADGIDVLNAVRPKRPKLPIIVITAHSSLSNAVASMRAGAVDFLVKPASPDRVSKALESALNDMIVDGELRPLTEKLSKKLTFDQLIGTAPAFQSAIDLAKKAAASNIPVLIEGESGAGKELIAQSIQSASNRANGPFIVVNCGAIPQNLIESLLFGHEKGAFTGAVGKHVGKFAEANGGTIFLDEIGELPLDAQVKLLRVLQEDEIEPVGGRTVVKVDVRVISATNRTLLHEVARGAFREDLFYRLNVVQICLPPLRERSIDIPALADHFLMRIAETEKLDVRTISPDASALLQAYNWPGNVRQLQNAIFRAAVLCDGSELTPRDFPQLLAQAQREAGALMAPRPAFKSTITGFDMWRPPIDDATSEAALSLVDDNGNMRSLEDLEAEVLRYALNRYRGRMSEVARRLKIGRSTLYRKVAEFGLEAADAA